MLQAAQSSNGAEVTHLPSQHLAEAVVQSRCATTLAAAVQGSAGLAIWQRALNLSITQAAQAARDASVCELWMVSCDELELLKERRFSTLSLPSLSEDLYQLAKLYCDIAGAAQIHIRLETVTDDACCRFHVDNVRYRLITTYAGAGTQWVLPDNEESAGVEQQAYNGPLGQLRAGDIALFRGKKSVQGAHILHRSPPCAGGPGRLVCVIDEASQAIP